MDGLRVLILGLGAAVAVDSGRVKFPSNCSLSEDCKNLINDMIEVDMSQRVTTKAALERANAQLHRISGGVP